MAIKITNCVFNNVADIDMKGDFVLTCKKCNHSEKVTDPKGHAICPKCNSVEILVSSQNKAS